MRKYCYFLFSPRPEAGELFYIKGNVMSPQEKAKKVGLIFIILLIVGGFVLMYTGNDAVVMGREKKEGILTAEQVKISFNSVKGRLIKEAVKEGQYVQKGDILMELDPTDTNLSIEKMQAEIAALDAQIKSMETNKGISHFHADTSEVQSHRQIEQQQAAVDSAKATLKNRKLIIKEKPNYFLPARLPCPLLTMLPWRLTLQERIWLSRKRR